MYIYIYTPNPNVTGLCFFLMNLLLCNVCYIAVFTRNI